MQHEVSNVQDRTPRLERAGMESTSTQSTAGRVPFGITRSQSQRIELVFALRQGGMLPITHELGQAITAEALDRFCEELRQAIAAGKDWWSFADNWSASGQRAYVSLDQVVGFTVRPLR